MSRFRADAESKGMTPDHDKGLVLGQALLILVGGIVALTLALLNLGAGGIFGVVAIGLLVVGVTAILLGLYFLFDAVRKRRRQWSDMAARSRFARANGLEYVASEAQPDLKGIIFRIGAQPTAYNVFRANGAMPYEFGNYTFTRSTANRRSTLPVSWGYVTLSLPTSAPHVILTGKSQSRRSYYDSSGLNRSEFSDIRFDLYHRPNHAVDITALFSAELLDLVAKGRMTLEMVESRVFVYQESWFRFEKAETFAKITRILDALDSGVRIPAT